MAIVLLSFSTVTNAFTSVVVNRPASATEGDTLFLQVSCSNDVIPTVPDGFVAVEGAYLAGTGSFHLYRKQVTASEPANYTCTVSAGSLNAAILCLRSDGPLVVHALATAVDTVGGEPKIWNGVTNTVPNTLLCCFGTFEGSTGAAPDAAMAEQWDFGSTTIRSYLMTQAIAVTGATGTRTAMGGSGSVAKSRNLTISLAEAGPFLGIRSHNTSPSGSSPLTVAKPTGTVEGDLLLLQVGLTADLTPTVPDGFTLIPNSEIVGSLNIRCYQKVAGVSEPADYSVTFASSTGTLALFTIYENEAGTVELDASDNLTNASGDRIFPSIITTQANALLTCHGSIGSNLASTPPGNMTERVDTGSTPRIYAMTGHVASIGATGTRTATGSAATSKCVSLAWRIAEGEPPPVLDPLVAPTGLLATGVSTSQIDLEWTDTNTDETNFRLERSDDGLSGWVEIATPITTTYSDTGLSPGRRYWYRVRAYRSEDESFSDYSLDAIGRTNLASPANLIATTISKNEITITWTDSNGEAEGYEVQRSLDEENWSSLTPVTETILEDTGLEPETTYYYRIRAFWEV